MAVDITSLFVAHLAHNRGPLPSDHTAQHPSKYAISAYLHDTSVFLTLMFQAGSAYCCYELLCHLGLCIGQRWDWLRSGLSARGLTSPEQLEIQATVIVEAGALFFDWTQPAAIHGGPHILVPSEATRYDLRIVEE